MSWQDPAPGEREAGERSWKVVRTAYDERVRVPRRRDWRPMVAIVAGVVVLAAAITPPGMAVLDSLRDAVRGEKNAAPALFSLPTAGRLLVDSGDGVWVVQRDGSKRLLAGYRDASWSPHGLYLAAVQGHELRALEPNGDAHWSIGRPAVALPRWSSAGGGDERVAYLSAGDLRVIGGDGKGDHLVARHVARMPAAWKPGSHILAFFAVDGNVRVVDADSKRLLWRTHVFAGRPAVLGWSSDGRRLVAVTHSELGTFGADGRVIALSATGGQPVAVAFAPRGHRFALLHRFNRERRTSVEVIASDDLKRRARLFTGAGAFGGLDWSPDGRWIVLDWDSADQWLFIRSAAVRRIVAISNVAASFGADSSLAGWCCP